jgi:hypothetical protein
LSLEATGVIEIKPSTSVGNRQTSTIHAMLVKPSQTRKTSVRPIPTTRPQTQCLKLCD